MISNAARTIVPLLTVCLSAAIAQAGAIYVDNGIGDNKFDGRSKVPVSAESGPVRSISRGLALVRPGDSLVITNHGVPYYESLSLVGSRFSGVPRDPFTLYGNGAIVDGSLPVPINAWTRVAGGVWKMTPWRKGLGLLLNDGAPLPETAAPPGESLPDLPAGNWCLWRGSIYLSVEKNFEPADLNLSFAVQDVGLTLFNVHDLIVSDLTFRHFRIDGINAHDQCRRVVLDNVVSIQNGRAGLTVGGSASVTASRCDFQQNRVQSVRLDELGGVELKESKVDAPPIEPPPAP